MPKKRIYSKDTSDHLTSQFCDDELSILNLRLPQKLRLENRSLVLKVT